MQKKLIALAVAALASTGAMAQVTFYGVLDAGVVSATGKGANGAADQKFNGIAGGVLSGNRLGFTAEEDLGEGLKAVGRFEFGTLNIDDTGAATTKDVVTSNATNAPSGTTPTAAITAPAQGNGINGTRQSFVGLNSAAVGQLVFGRIQTPGFDIATKHDGLTGSTVFSPLHMLAPTVASSQTIHNGARVNNAIYYTSPKIAGSTTVKAAVARNNSELSTAAFNGDLATIGVEFSQGPLDISAVYSNIDEFSATADHSEYMVGVNYNLGVAKVLTQYIGTERDNVTTADVKGKFFEVGVQVPVGKGTVKVAVGRAETDEAAKPDAATLFGIDYEHAFGKRTTGFVGLSQTKVGSFNAAVKVAGVAASKDESITAVGAGLRLTF
jgi:predicted porin